MLAGAVRSQCEEAHGPPGASLFVLEAVSSALPEAAPRGAREPRLSFLTSEVKFSEFRVP